MPPFRVAFFAAIVLLAARAEAHEGWGIIVHPQLGIVFTDIPGNTIWRAANGDVESLIRNVHSHALLLGADGAIYGTNAEVTGDAAGVWRLDSTGRVTDVIPRTRGLTLGLQSFLITRSGDIYSANRYDYRRPSVVLLRRDTGGVVHTVAPQFTAIDGMAELPDGGVLVADGAHLRTVTLQGVVTVVAGPLTRARFGEDLLGISAVRASMVHVADHAGRRILRVSLRTRDVKEVAKSSFWWAPAGVDVTPDGIFVLEHLRPPLSLLGDLRVGPYLRVRKYGPHGSASMVARVWGRYSRRTAVIAAVTVVIAGWAAFRLRK